MKKINLLICIFLILSKSVISADFTYGRGADEAEDSYMSDGANSGTNYSTGSLMYCRIGSINQNTILKFPAIDPDISGETITSATLTIVERFTTADHTLYLHRVRTARDWIIGEVTWDDYKTSTAWGTGGGENTTSDIIATATASYNAVSEGDDYHWEMDVTADVQAWADGDNNEGWIILANTPGTSTSETQIWTANWGNVSTRPYLEITTGVADVIIPKRRRDLLNKYRGEYESEKISIFAYMPTDNK